jgi:hypothetical protein
MTTDCINDLPPEPEHSGTKADQSKSLVEQDKYQPEGIASGGLAQFPLTTVVQAISELGIKGHSAMALLFASTKRLESDLLEERKEKASSISELNSFKEKYFQEKENNAVLKERVTSAQRLKTLQNVFLTLGGLLAGLGGQNLIQRYEGSSLILTMLGLCFLIAGWLWPNPISKEA